MSGLPPNLSFDNEGRLITVSIQLKKIELHLLDPETLETLALLELPEKASFDDNSGGGYFHLDNQGRVMLAPADRTIQILEVVESDSGLQWQTAESYDVSSLPEGTNIHDVIPDYQGNLWFVTNTGLLGYLQPDSGEIFTYQMQGDDEVIQNSFGVDKDGLYVVSTDALYQFKINPQSRLPYYTWREPYEKGDTQKPGMLSHGSGTSPSLIGEDLVAIVDDAVPNAQIRVFRRKENIIGERKVCTTAIFEPGESATENSLMVYGNAMVVQNDYGHDYNGNALQTSPGITRVDVRADRSGCNVTWYNDKMLSQSLPRLSTATGLLYFYTFKKPDPDASMGGWYLTAVDFSTGEELWDRLIGAGTGSMIDTLSSVTAPVVLGPNGAAYVGIRTGVVMAADHAN